MIDMSTAILWFCAYFAVGLVFFGFYKAKYGLNGLDGILTFLSLFFWPLIFVVKGVVLIVSIPIIIGEIIGERK